MGSRFHLLARSRFALAALAVAGAVLWSLAASRPVDAEAAGEIPSRLADTGLYSDIASHTIASDVLAFEPQYPLWTDGATKRRWIRIPSGTTIDASNPDHFVFPVGTRLWKEFSFAARVETRMSSLGADRHWHFASYVWSPDERSAVLAPEEGVRAACESAPGVPFDIPSRIDCLACHSSGVDAVLGFNALQLSADRDPLAPHAQPVPKGAVDLGELVRRGVVRDLPQRFVDTPPRIEAASPRERAVLGYLNANCGMCHSSRGAIPGLDLDLSYSLAVASGSSPRALATTIGRPSRFAWPNDVSSLRISRERPDQSVLTRRMASRQALAQMPPLGTHLRDDGALALVSDWMRQDLGPACRVETVTSIPFPNSTPSKDRQP